MEAVESSPAPELSFSSFDEQLLTAGGDPSRSTGDVLRVSDESLEAASARSLQPVARRALEYLAPSPGFSGGGVDCNVGPAFP